MYIECLLCIWNGFKSLKENVSESKNRQKLKLSVKHKPKDQVLCIVSFTFHCGPTEYVLLVLFMNEFTRFRELKRCV